MRGGRSPLCESRARHKSLLDQPLGGLLATLPAGTRVGSSSLRRGALVEPVAVAEHQDVRTRQSATVRAVRQVRGEQASVVIDFRQDGIGRPDVLGAGFQALQVVDRAVDFANVGRIETRFGELTIDIAGEDESPMRQACCPAVQHVETLMRNGASVERQTVAIKAPAIQG